MENDRPIGSLSTQDPCSVYPQVRGLNSADFQLPATGLTDEQHDRVLMQLNEYLSVQQANFLGYQVNQNLDYTANLQQYLNCHINNVGDPFITGNLTVNSKLLERAVLDYYASLWNARWPHQPQDGESYWGYVVSMGCTEGNLYALWNARDYLAGKSIRFG